MREDDRIRVRHMIDAVEIARSEAPDVPWPAIIAMRNRLVHGYFDIDSDIVWNTVNVELPLLLPKLRSMLGQGTP